jgi:hypothetical protein
MQASFLMGRPGNIKWRQSAPNVHGSMPINILTFIDQNELPDHERLPVRPTTMLLSNFITFIPSMRKIVFFQKNIRQLNVEFVVKMVLVQSQDIFTLGDDAFSLMLRTI